jgi:hypothetical protein
MVSATPTRRRDSVSSCTSSWLPDRKGVEADPKQPGSDRRAMLERGQFQIDDDEDLLRHILRVLLAHTQPPQGTPHEVEVGQVDLAKRVPGRVPFVLPRHATSWLVGSTPSGQHGFGSHNAAVRRSCWGGEPDRATRFSKTHAVSEARQSESARKSLASKATN